MAASRRTSIPGRGERLALALALALVPACARERAGGDTESPLRVAVASNFATVQDTLAKLFTSRTGIAVESSAASTGTLYAQIRNGAPFDVFLAADRERPRRLEEEGLAVGDTRFTYARGRLALYGAAFDDSAAARRALESGDFTHIAIANPKTAPYGAAALQALARLGLDAVASGRIVAGENIAQAYEFARTGAAELAFVALSQVARDTAAHAWIPPESSYDPIRQDAVLLARARDSAAARRYLAFLRGDDARRIMAAFGYAPGPGGP